MSLKYQLDYQYNTFAFEKYVTAILFALMNTSTRWSSFLE